MRTSAKRANTRALEDVLQHKRPDLLERLVEELDLSVAQGEPATLAADTKDLRVRAMVAPSRKAIPVVDQGFASSSEQSWALANSSTSSSSVS